MADGVQADGAGAIVYCLVPADSARLHVALRGHFRDESTVEVVVERRAGERRAVSDRRVASPAPRDPERRMIRSRTGRRLGERRVPCLAVAPPALPRRVRPYADRLAFVERVDRPAQAIEDLDTARLVMRIQSGRRDLFEQLYLRYFDRVYGYLWLMLRDDHVTEEVAQQVFVSVLGSLAGYEHRGQPFRGWLFTVVRNQAIAELKRQGRQDVLDPMVLGALREGQAQLTADDPVDGPATLEWITDRDLLLFVERLPLAQRQVLLLRYMLHLTHPEIADVLGRSHADIRVLHSRALAFLRDRLAAVGRVPRDCDRTRMRRIPKYAQVLRARRYALIA